LGACNTATLPATCKLVSRASVPVGSTVVIKSGQLVRHAACSSTYGHIMHGS
jgi:hypothetical protein